MLRNATECYSLAKTRPAPNQASSRQPSASTLQPHPSPRVSLVAVWEQNDGMSHNVPPNVPQCPRMSHNVPPKRAEWDVRTERQGLTGFKCPTMSHNVPQCPTLRKKSQGVRVVTWGSRGVALSRLLSPLRGFWDFGRAYPGLTPWANFCRLFEAHGSRTTKCDGLLHPM